MPDRSILSKPALRPAALGVLVSLLATTGVAAQSDCGLCSREVVVTADLASCFLDRYAQLAADADENVVVDLSDCASRGIVEALPGPQTDAPEPDTMFMVSHEQLECLKNKLEEPGLELDPSAKIDLESCG